jgi:GntR family transcriptional regulator, transcriptional repressor for pyruvate dehydrogenase complex
MIQKVKRSTLSDQVTQSLIAMIDAQDLAPGDTLPSEGQLADEFGASRPVIREALKTLQGEGLIEVVTGKNAVIKPISSTMLRKFFERAIAMKSASFRDLIEVRLGLELQSVTLAAERCADADLTALAQVMDQMRDHLQDHVRFAEHDVAFHLLIASAAKNPMIYYLLESLRDAMRENVLQGMRIRFSPEDCARVVLRHEAILQALREHDVQAAQQAMQEHFTEALRALHEKE